MFEKDYHSDSSCNKKSDEVKRMLLKSLSILYEDLSSNKRKTVKKRIDNERNAKKRFNYKNFRTNTLQHFDARNYDSNDSDSNTSDSNNSFDQSSRQNYNALNKMKVLKTNSTLYLDQILRKPSESLSSISNIEMRSSDEPITNNELFIENNKDDKLVTYNSSQDKWIQVDLLIFNNLNTTMLISKSKKELVRIIEYYVCMMNIFSKRNCKNSDKSIQVPEESKTLKQKLQNIFWFPSTITSVFNKSEQ